MMILILEFLCDFLFTACPIGRGDAPTHVLTHLLSSNSPINIFERKTAHGLMLLSSSSNHHVLFPQSCFYDRYYLQVGRLVVRFFALVVKYDFLLSSKHMSVT